MTHHLPSFSELKGDSKKLELNSVIPLSKLLVKPEDSEELTFETYDKEKGSFFLIEPIKYNDDYELIDI